MNRQCMKFLTWADFRCYAIGYIWSRHWEHVMKGMSQSMLLWWNPWCNFISSHRTSSQQKSTDRLASVAWARKEIFCLLPTIGYYSHIVIQVTQQLLSPSGIARLQCKLYLWINTISKRLTISDDSTFLSPIGHTSLRLAYAVFHKCGNSWHKSNSYNYRDVDEIYNANETSLKFNFWQFHNPAWFNGTKGKIIHSILFDPKQRYEGSYLPITRLQCMSNVARFVHLTTKSSLQSTQNWMLQYIIFLLEVSFGRPINSAMLDAGFSCLKAYGVLARKIYSRQRNCAPS